MSEEREKRRYMEEPTQLNGTHQSGGGETKTLIKSKSQQLLNFPKPIVTKSKSTGRDSLNDLPVTADLAERESALNSEFNGDLALNDDGNTNDNKVSQQITKTGLPHLSKPIIRSLSGTQFKYSTAYANNNSTAPSSVDRTRESSRNRSQQQAPPLPLSARSPHPLSKSSSPSSSSPSLSSSSVGHMQRAWSSQQVNSKEFGTSQQLSQLPQSLHANRIRNSTLVMFHPPKVQGRPNTMQPHSQSAPSIPYRNGLSSSSKSTASLPTASPKKHSSTPNKSYPSSSTSKVLKTA